MTALRDGSVTADGPIAVVSRLLTWSVVDGPGNRFVLFLQGCNYRCAACHNPHTMGLCDHCGLCVPGCPSGALTMKDGKVVHDPDVCINCDACLRVCPRHANPMVRHLTVADVLALLRENAAFLSGITVSGGEATLQLDFIAALFAAVKAAPDLRHLTCFIDSNGHLGADKWAKVLPMTDGVMADVKAFDPVRHRRLTRQGNVRPLASARLLAAAGKLHELRFLMIPGETDGADEIAALAAFVTELGPETRVRLNAFQHHGVRGPAHAWPKMSRQGVEAAAAALRAAGLRTVALPAVWLP